MTKFLAIPEAAIFLKMSHWLLLRTIEAKEISCHLVDKRWCLSLDDLTAYKQQLESNEREWLENYLKDDRV
jgi:hypothetical protein